MPVYLVHGFRWPREGFTGIRVHAIVHNLEDCSVEYIQNEASKSAILQSFRQTHPQIMQHLEDTRTGRSLEFIEQYDPQDESSETAVSQTYAFIADRVVTIAAGTTLKPSVTSKEVVDQTHTAVSSPPTASAPTGPAPKKPPTTPSTTSSRSPFHNTSALYLNVEEAMSNGPAVPTQAWEAMAELRDKLAEGERIGWWIVYNGDPERAVIGDDESATISGTESEVDSSVDNTNDDEADLKADVQAPGSATDEIHATNQSILSQPLPTLIPPTMRHLIPKGGNKDDSQSTSDSTARAIPYPPTVPQPEPSKPSAEPVPSSRSRTSRSNFSFPLRRKASKTDLPSPKQDTVPEPPALKEINKKDGRRYRFFGSKADKKAT